MSEARRFSVVASLESSRLPAGLGSSGCPRVTRPWVPVLGSFRLAIQSGDHLRAVIVTLVLAEVPEWQAVVAGDELEQEPLDPE